MSTQAKEDRSAADFGANEWMVEELYEKYLQDKNSVDPAWWDFFADFLPPGSADVPSSDVTAGTVDPLPEGQGTRGEQAPAHAPAAEAADAPRTRTTTAAAHREREEQHTPYLRSDLPPAPPVAAADTATRVAATPRGRPARPSAQQPRTCTGGTRRPCPTNPPTPHGVTGA